MNRSFLYASVNINQLSRFIQEGYLDQAPSSIATVVHWMDTSSSLEDSTRAYLDINCAHCHNEFGSANNTSLYYDINITNTDLLGYCKFPISAGGDATGGRNYDIVPGSAENSNLVYRLSSTESEIAMPELGRTMNHTEGIQLITDWINSLDPDESCN